MQIPFDQFEQYIDETILKRGLSYFQQGCVHEPEEIAAGIFEATVTGSEHYTVQLVISNNIITNYSCDCPYDAGPVCKHIAAVIFHLQQETLNLSQKDATAGRIKNKKKPAPATRKTAAQQVKELLDQVPHEALKEFISERSAGDSLFRNSFLSAFTWLNKTDSKEFYTKQVRSVLNSVAGRKGFIEWDETRHAGKAINDLLALAQKHIEHKNYQTAFFICTTVMEEMTEALQYADDSNGDIGGCIDTAYQALHEMASLRLPGEIRKQLFDYALLAFEKNIYSGWDWHTGMLSLAARLFATEEEAQKIIEQSDKAQESEYEMEALQEIKLHILRKTKGEKEADKFIEQNLSNPSLRRKAISKAIKSKNYQKSIVLAQDGIKQDAKEKPGLAMEWYDWLLKTAQLQKDREKTVEYARILFINYFRHEQDYYQVMKDNAAAEKWNAFVEGIIKDIQTKSRWGNVEQIANIYIHEQWWNRLMQLVVQNPSLHYIELYEKQLAKDYAPELAQLYERAIIDYIKNSTGRNHYQTACRYLRRMRKLGAGEKVNNLIEEFRKQYPQRRALLEELNTV